MIELLNTEQAAQQLGVTAGTLMCWRSTRRYALRFVKIGRKVRYRPADLEAFLEARTVGGTNEPHGSVRPQPRAGRKKAVIAA